ncbi:MAG: diadenylate cyclase CdaA [Spirochaetaceae bacterium]|nr:diadenylate cyclase CdaA [Spirochaetaceae bacterium]MBQ8560103.1 diadenylate cyclase CdaA [Spirochaetaceae bacterium]MBR2362625.1 diadenylate cyclase CdaA [Spirochaetaceae bacterium]
MNVFPAFGSVYDYISPVLDVCFLTFILYKAYEVLVKTNGLQLLKVVIILGIAYVLATILKLKLILWILNALTPSLLVGFFVVFQPEVRKMILRLGQTEWRPSKKKKHMYVDSVLTSAEELSQRRRGMLVVFAGKTDIQGVIDSGTIINAHITSSLLSTIFEFDTKLHDGAVVIRGGKIISAGCFLPVSEQYDIEKTFGTRHRAALGLSEQTDAIILVVSEETGALSIACESRLYYDLSLDQVRRMLEDHLELSDENFTSEEAGSTDGGSEMQEEVS